jgi:hypothetical protein
MDSISETVRGELFTRVEAQASKANTGLGPNQLVWLRRNITSFKYAEEQRLSLGLDKLRAAYVTGLVGR